MSDVSLLTLRREIDEIDAQIVALLSRRFKTTKEVGKLKAQTGTRAVDAEREAEQVARYRRLASDASVNPELVVSLFRDIIDEVVRNHQHSGSVGADPNVFRAGKPHENT